LLDDFGVLEDGDILLAEGKVIQVRAYHTEAVSNMLGIWRNLLTSYVS